MSCPAKMMTAHLHTQRGGEGNLVETARYFRFKKGFWVLGYILNRDTRVRVLIVVGL